MGRGTTQEAIFIEGRPNAPSAWVGWRGYSLLLRISCTLGFLPASRLASGANTYFTKYQNPDCASSLVYSIYNPMNVYTGQNPRRRVVSVKTSQMRTICTLIWRESCLLVYIFTSAFILGWCIFVDKHFP